MPAVTTRKRARPGRRSRTGYGVTHESATLVGGQTKPARKQEAVAGAAWAALEEAEVEKARMTTEWCYRGDAGKYYDTLRPHWLREIIGQKAVVHRLAIVINACKKRKEP